MSDFFIACEDPLAQACGERLLQTCIPNVVIKPIATGGNSQLRAKLSNFTKIAEHFPVLLLTDLDAIGCAPSLIQTWIQGSQLPSKLFFRVAVRETESWLLADRQGFSAWSGVPIAQIPLNPDAESDPKRLLLERVRRYGSRNLKADILPQASSTTSKVGLGYNAQLIDFVCHHWSVERAIEQSDSLKRTYHRIQAFADLAG